MEENKKFTLIVTLIIILCIICAIEGFVIYDNSRQKIDFNHFDNFDTFASSIIKKFKNDKKRNDDLFDRFFNDDFFSQHTNPFDEMERLHRELEKMTDQIGRNTFRGYWRSWFSDRFLGGSDDVQVSIEDKKDSYLVVLKIPNLKKNNLNIEIDKDGISVNGVFSQLAEKKDANGKVIARSEIHRKISKKYPIPHDADYEKAQIKNKKDKILITLPKKQFS